MHTLIIELNAVHNFYKVTCPEGDYISDFVDGVTDPKDYYGCKEMYVPTVLSEDEIREKYHCVTDEEHAAYEKAREEAYAKEEEEMRNKLMNPETEEAE